MELGIVEDFRDRPCMSGKHRKQDVRADWGRSTEESSSLAKSDIAWVGFLPAIAANNVLRYNWNPRHSGLTPSEERLDVDVSTIIYHAS